MQTRPGESALSKAGCRDGRAAQALWGFCSAVLLILLMASCEPDAGSRSTASSSAPADFEVNYKWVEGSLPPPHHYRIEIRIPPTGKGEVKMVPDYDFNTPPTWKSEFDLATNARTVLYRDMESRGLFSKSWKSSSSEGVGGATEQVSAVANGKNATADADSLPPDQSDDFKAICSAIRNAVPKEIWKDLEAKREAYGRLPTQR